MFKFTFNSIIKKILKNKVLTIFLVSLFIFGIVFSISKYNATLQIVNKFIQDNYYKARNNQLQSKVSDKIIVVEIDEKTLWYIWRFPFDRKVYVPFLENLKEAGVWIIGFDIIFADKTNSISDLFFSEAIKNAWNVVMWLSSFPNWSVQKPLDMFLKYSLSSWYLEPTLDKSNETVYSALPVKNFRSKKEYEFFPFAILRAYYEKNNKNISLSQVWKYTSTTYDFTSDIKIPLSKTWRKDVLINFSDESLYKKVSFSDIYDKKKFENLKKYVDFKDKIILVWTAAEWIKDIFKTPNGRIYWVYIHANTINTILNKSFLEYFNQDLELFIIFLLILLSVFFNYSRYWLKLLFSNLSIITIFLIIFPLIVVRSTNYIQNYYLEMFLALILSLITSNLLKYLVENKNKNKLNKALSEYVSENIAKEILSWNWNINLDWERKKITIFFSDIQWFTTISEKFSPELLVSFLRQYLTAMSNIIMDEKGFINKYEWDAIMALWWVFWIDKNSSYNACKSALTQQKVLNELNQKWKQENFSEIKTRIGIHTWDAIVWNIWSQGRKMEFTALWDSVNLASRLEWVNKFYGTFICVSEDVYMEVKDRFDFRYLDTIRVKWKTKWISIYELISLKWEMLIEKQEIVNEFLHAIEYYKKRDFVKALEIFIKLSDLWDTPSTTYKKRCENYIVNNPWENWDGIFSMTEK